MTQLATTRSQDRCEVLQEFVDSRDAALRVDPSGSILRGVKLLGLKSRNGRRYREQALRRAMPLYEGAKVNVNHPQGDPLSPRDYRDRIGVVRGVYFEPGAGLFGALHFNPRHPLAEQLAWDAANAPENVGLSHNVLAKTVREGAGLIVEAIEKVQSVDLVADPATTVGLFEQSAETPASGAPVADTEDEAVVPARLWEQLTLHDIELHRPDLLASLAEQHQAELAQRQSRIEALTASESTATRKQRITELLMEHGLPLPTTDATGSKITSESFLESLQSAPDDESLVQLVADRAQAIDEAACRRSGVVAREQALGGEHASATPGPADFVAAITGRSPSVAR